ncbi:hypothetical protein GTO27_07580 [Candidatus Bathyarchaeota archaeon]|nr:hypothetical protein [Candidatus Bathyarchaeota archaeon]
MNTLAWLISFLKSGTASFFINGTESLHLKIERERINLNLMKKDLLMNLLESADVRRNSLFKKLTIVRKIAQELRDKGLTLTISYKGALLLTLGSQAKPTLSQAVTGTDAIEINNLKQLKQILA